MFGKKQKECEKLVREFLPSFGTVESFNDKYMQGNNLVELGKQGDVSICAAIDESANQIVVINDRDESVINQFISPIMSIGNRSYIVYDPDGVYHERMVNEVRSLGYDVQLIDLENEDNLSRVDLFEVVNITKDPQPLSFILSNSIKCEPKELEIINDILMAMMQYELAEHGMIDIIKLDALFKGICDNDDKMLAKIEECQLARPHMLSVYEAKADARESAFQKLAENLFNCIVAKAQRPNIFTITMHNQKSAMFVKRVPEQYRFLMTVLMFNLEASAAMCEKDDIHVLLIDSMKEQWHDEKLLEDAIHAIDDIAERCYCKINVIKEIDTENRYDDTLLIYMHSDDVATNVFVYDNLKFKHYPREEHDELSKRFFKGKMLPDEVLERAPITMDAMATIDGALAVDTAHDIKPIVFERLG